jgi:hypothetical protein
LRAFGVDPEHMTDDELEAFRPRLAERGLPESMPVAELRRILITVNTDFRDKAPVTAAEAATVILDGVRAGAWRILIGKDAARLDAFVRANPDATYDYAEMSKSFQADGT